MLLALVHQLDWDLLLRIAVGSHASRIAASIVTGMGVLAGGAILRTAVSVQGLTKLERQL